MAVVGYVPFEPDSTSVEAGWVADAFGCEIRQPAGVPDLNRRPTAPLPDLASMAGPLAPLLRARWVIAEGPGGLLWPALLRSHGFTGGVTTLPYLNPRQWWDVGAASIYRRFRDPRDRVFVGSTLSARIYRRLGVESQVGEPYGIDDRRFRPRLRAFEVLERFAIPRGRLLLFAGRSQADKDLYRLLRVALKARILFPDLQVVLASHVIDEDYVATIRRELGPESGVHFVTRPGAEELADLYGAADVFATAATSHFETFGRAPAEALACGTPAVAPRYDGFTEVLDQPGGTLVGVELDEAGPHASEDEMLRAVYDVLSAPNRVPSRDIAEAAHRRFGRSRTLRLLAHVVAEDPGVAPPVDLPPADLKLPRAWTEEIEEMNELSPAAALRHLWTNWDHDGKAAFDGDFVQAVRRALCDVASVSVRAVSIEEAVPCQ